MMGIENAGSVGVGPGVSVVVLRHPKERISKCSLRFFHERPDFRFFKAKPGFRFDATGYVLLGLNAPVLSRADAGRPLLLLDSTWRLLPQLEACVTGSPERRSLPAGVQTAYPRVSKIAEDPAAGLASVEALYLALRIMGREDATLLEQYHWREAFLTGLASVPGL